MSVESAMAPNASDDIETTDKFNLSCDSHDFRRKPSRQNSYLEAVKQIGGMSP